MAKRCAIEALIGVHFKWSASNLRKADSHCILRRFVSREIL